MTAQLAIKREIQSHSVAGFDRSISGFLRDAARVSRRDPGMALFFIRAAARQQRAAARRREWHRQGVNVPPLMIMSVTRRCNLSCTGCFVHAQERSSSLQMSKFDLERVLSEARDLGVSIVALAGGEPLTRPEIIRIAAKTPEILFLLFTNGALVENSILDELTGARNIIPIVSLEGFEGETDGRRGQGVYQRALAAMEQMRHRRMFFGTSVMITRPNFALVTSRTFVRDLVKHGVRLFFYVDYVPIEPGTEHLVPSERQRSSEPLTIELLRREFSCLFLAASASEGAYGGCMAAGKGFVHVNAEGDLEPCPFSPFSDSNLRTQSLLQALDSPLLRMIRDSGEHLSESEGGCALWTKQGWLQSMVASAQRSEGRKRNTPRLETPINAPTPCASAAYKPAPEPGPTTDDVAA